MTVINHRICHEVQNMRIVPVSGGPLCIPSVDLKPLRPLFVVEILVVGVSPYKTRERYSLVYDNHDSIPI